MKGALRICTEHGLPGVEGIRHDDLRTLLAAQPDFANVKRVRDIRGSRTACAHPFIWT